FIVDYKKSLEGLLELWNDTELLNPHVNVNLADKDIFYLSDNIFNGIYNLTSIENEIINGSFTIPSALIFFLITFVAPIIVMTVYLMIHGKKHGSMLDGAAELIELLLSTLSNTVSYARIFAMNAVHGALSQIFLLTQFVPPPHEGQLGVVHYIGMALGALVILALEGLFSFIQTLRLQWVEFFSKVGYKGTGFKFQSVAIERRFSTFSPKA
ncbi:MAG: V-type ATPase 116kDa subunit family protein, partial [Candidatus Thorarchaeota archaeon]